MTLRLYNNKLHLCDLVFQHKRGGMEKSIIEELIGGMPSWTEETNYKGADAELFFPERGATIR